MRKQKLGLALALAVLLISPRGLADTTIVDTSDPNHVLEPLDDTKIVTLNDGGAYEVTNQGSFAGIDVSGGTSATVDGNIETSKTNESFVTGINAEGASHVDAKDVSVSTTVDETTLPPEHKDGEFFAAGIQASSDSTVSAGNITVSGEVKPADAKEAVESREIFLVGAETESSAVIETGSITVTGNDNKQGIGVWDTNVDDGSTNITVNGGISVLTGGEADGVAIRDEQDNQSVSTIEVKGDVKAESDKMFEYGVPKKAPDEEPLVSSTASSVLVISPDKAVVTVNGGITAESLTGSNGVEVWGQAGDADITVSTGSIVSKTDKEYASESGNEEDYAYGVDTSGDGKLTVNVNGGITAQADFATGVHTYAAQDAKALDSSISVSGDIAADGIGSAAGLSVLLDDKGKSDIRVDGEVRSYAEDGYAVGAEIYEYDDDSSSNVVLNGNVTVDGKYGASGLLIDAYGTNTRSKVELQGNLDARANEEVVDISTTAGGGAAVEVEVVGNVSAAAFASDEQATVRAVSAFSYELDPNTQILIKGDVAATGKNGDEADALYLSAGGGKIGVMVDGNVTSTGSAIHVAEILTVSNEYEEITLQVNPDELVDDEGLKEDFIMMLMSESDEIDPDDYSMYYNVKQDFYYLAKKGQTESALVWREEPIMDKASLDVLVRNDDDALVHGDKFGLEIENNNPDLSGSILVDGTLSGGEAGVFVSETAVTDNLTLTVWKIDSDLVAASEDADGKLTENKAFEETIQYIIRMEQPEAGGSFSVDGTRKYEDYDVANWNDTLTVRLNIQNGYSIEGVYNGSDCAVRLEKREDGNYYMTVPNGGGVSLRVFLRKDETAEDAPAIEIVRIPAADGWNALEKEPANQFVIPWAGNLLTRGEKEELAALPPVQQMLVVLVKAGFEDAVKASGIEMSAEARAIADKISANLRDAVKVQYRWENDQKIRWYVIELVMRGNRNAKYAFRQLEDGTWVFRMW